MAVKMVWPASCKIITQKFGNRSARYVSGRHTGLDIGCRAGSPIYSATDGKVIKSGWMGAYGNTVEIQVNDSMVCSYHHMSKIAVSKGTNVSAGKTIGYIGSTGNSTGPHLHFEVRINGKAVDPEPYLSGAKTVDQASYVQPSGAGDVFKFPAQMLKVFSWLTETTNWLRVGMVIGGAILLLMAFVGVAKATVLGKTAMKTVTGKTKKAVKSNGKS